MTKCDLSMKKTASPPSFLNLQLLPDLEKSFPRIGFFQSFERVEHIDAVGRHRREFPPGKGMETCAPGRARSE